MTRSGNAGLRRKAAAVLAVMLPAFAFGAAIAEDGRWVVSGSDGAAALTAGYAEAGRFEWIWFTCTAPGAGKVRLNFSGPNWGLQEAMAHTVVADVDGTAFVLATTAARDDAGRRGLLSHESTTTQLSGLLGALKAGDRVEISGPVGRMVVPLKGSGKALQGLQAGCG